MKFKNPPINQIQAHLLPILSL